MAAHLSVSYRQPKPSWVIASLALGLMGIFALPFLPTTGETMLYIRYAPCWTALIYAATTSPLTILGRLLAWKPLVSVGVISYSLFLYNQIISIIGKHFLSGIQTGSLAWCLIYLGVVAVCGIVGYYVAEYPGLVYRERLRARALASTPVPAQVRARMESVLPVSKLQ